MPVALLFWIAVLAEWSLVTERPFDGALVEADNQANFYAVDGRNALFKYDSLGNELFRYQRNGKLTSVDVTDPLEPLLYYAPSQTVAVLDNTLSAKATLSLQPLGLTLATAVCRSSDGNAWVWDGSDFKLKKFDYAGNALRESTDLLQQTGAAPSVHFMVEHDQKVYLCDSARGVLVTDLYGNYENTLPLKGLGRFQFVNDQLAYFDGNHMLLYDVRTARTDTVALDGVEPFHQGVYANGRLVTLGQNGLSLYRRKSP